MPQISITYFVLCEKLILKICKFLFQIIFLVWYIYHISIIDEIFIQIPDFLILFSLPSYYISFFFSTLLFPRFLSFSLYLTIILNTRRVSSYVHTRSIFSCSLRGARLSSGSLPVLRKFR